ncbi:DUF4181 domain-containing protein [Psychrobacillus sp. FSL K6-2684]|uniref:DUF4181 domain-containing protein n=1 Tax=unclassified Psychrobacillus TaxID=2636677 RepID=UPI001CD9ED23|nr:DUF4181 domain-containing protein [Psychrobacillus sp. AK 1817]
MRFLVFFIVLIFIGFLLEKIINKLLRVEKKKISETSGKRIDRWGRGIILLIFLFTLPFVIFGDSTNIIKWYWIVYITLLMGFQAFLEWKYLENSKQYVTTIIFIILSVIIMYNIEYFLPLLS